MVIDFHTHAFPDKIAKRALQSLVDGAVRASNCKLVPVTDGTVSGLKKIMSECNIDLSVVLPIATRVTQSESINNFAESINCENIISFGSLHPLQEDWEYCLKDLAERGFKGIKLHPEFQDFFIDSKESVRILRLAEDLGLYTVIHAGKDVGFLPPVHATPEKIKNTLDYISGKYLVCAHLGSWSMWDDVKKYLVGTKVSFDTAYTANSADKEQTLRIIRNHGADKIIFGSDAPWQSPKSTLEFIRSLGLTETELELIEYKNAKRILGI